MGVIIKHPSMSNEHRDLPKKQTSSRKWVISASALAGLGVIALVGIPVWDRVKLKPAPPEGGYLAVLIPTPATLTNSVGAVDVENLYLAFQLALQSSFGGLVVGSASATAITDVFEDDTGKHVEFLRWENVFDIQNPQTPESVRKALKAAGFENSALQNVKLHKIRVRYQTRKYPEDAYPHIL